MVKSGLTWFKNQLEFNWDGETTLPFFPFKICFLQLINGHIFEIIENSSNEKDNFDITKDSNEKILRIQNSSYLKKKHLDKIIKVIKKSIND